MLNSALGAQASCLLSARTCKGCPGTIGIPGHGTGHRAVRMPALPGHPEETSIVPYENPWLRKNTLASPFL